MIQFSNRENNKFGLTVGYILLISGLILAIIFFMFIYGRIYLTNFRLQWYLLYCVIILLCSGLLSLCLSITSFWIGDIYIIIGSTSLLVRFLPMLPTFFMSGLFLFFYIFFSLYGLIFILPSIILILIGRKLRKEYNRNLSFFGAFISCGLIYLNFSMFFPIFFI